MGNKAGQWNECFQSPTLIAKAHLVDLQVVNSVSCCCRGCQVYSSKPTRQVSYRYVKPCKAIHFHNIQTWQILLFLEDIAKHTQLSQIIRPVSDVKTSVWPCSFHCRNRIRRKASASERGAKLGIWIKMRIFQLFITCCSKTEHTVFQTL